MRRPQPAPFVREICPEGSCVSSSFFSAGVLLNATLKIAGGFVPADSSPCPPNGETELGLLLPHTYCDASPRPVARDAGHAVEVGVVASKQTQPLIAHHRHNGGIAG